MVGVVQVMVFSMSVTSAVAGVSPGGAEGEVGVGDDGVGGVIGDAAGEGGAVDHPADAVGVGDVWGVGAVCDADGDVCVGRAPVVGVVWDADGEGATGDALAVGAAGGAPTVRVLGPLGAAPQRRGISSPLLAGGAVGVAAGGGGGCDGVVDVDGAAWGGRW